MTPTRWLPVAAVAGHLVLVVCGAARLNLVPSGTAADFATRLYANLSGADSSYGFFAPGVDPQIRVRFRLADATGRERVVTLLDGATGEANLRKGGVGRLLPTGTPDRNERLLRSLAASVFLRHPEAGRVTALTEVYGVRRSDGRIEFPSMADYRGGMRPGWCEVNAVTFARPAIAAEHRPDAASAVRP